MSTAIFVLGALVGVTLLALLLLGRSRRIARGRWGRAARLGRLSARLATSWLGATLRRLFLSRARRARYDEARRRADAEAVVRTMGEMKGAVMKLGQMMSFVSDDVPAEYRAALRSLQADAPPMDFALVRDVVERELGKPLERAFARFDEAPLAAASIGQVHRARLASGEEVVVKVQYPGVGDAIRSDLANVAVLYRMIGLFYPALEPGPIVEELRDRITEELDYRTEAQNQRMFRALYEGHPFIHVPRVYASHSTRLVLTSEYVHGRRFDAVLAADEATRQRFAEVLYRFVFGSILRHGVFNGDPHPGNYLLTDDGRVTFLDYGCVKYFPAPMLATWTALIRAHMDGDVPRFRALAVEAGFLAADAVVAGDELFDYFGYYYEPFQADRRFRYTREYNNRSFAMMFKPSGRFEGITKRLNMPRDYMLANRLTWGVTSILASLEGEANWHHIHRELVYGDPPSTELGEQEHRWSHQRNQEGTMSKPNRLTIVAVALTALSAGCTPADDAATGEAEAAEVGGAVAQHARVVSTFSSTIEASLSGGTSNAVGDGLRARIDAALERLVVDADCISVRWVLNTATVRFDACELVDSGLVLDGAVGLRLRPLVPSVVVTIDALTLGEDSVTGSLTGYPIGPLADLTFGIDADLTFAGEERTLSVDGIGVASGTAGVTLSGDGAVTSPEINADATLTDVHVELGDCLPSSGSVEFQTDNVEGILLFLATTPETGEVSLRIPPFPAANIALFPPCA